MVRRGAPVEDAIASGLVPPVPLTEREAIGVEEPIPRRLLTSSKKKLVLSCVRSPLAPMNGTDPAVNPDR
jgi:hypothetical protein